MRRRNPRAYILILTLIMGSVILALLFSVAPGGDLGRLQIGRQEDFQSNDAAFSVSDVAFSALIYQPDFGGNSTLTYTAPDKLSHGNLTFNSKSGQAYSTSNIYGTAPVAGWSNRQVPPYQVHVVGNGVSSRINTHNQAIVQPFRQVMVEDFNADGQGGKPRLPWLHFPGTSGFGCQNQYLFMGSPKYQQNLAQWMAIAAPRWKDYDFEAHVAYYGSTSFGFSMRNSDGWEGYRLELQPKIGLEQIDGIDATVTAVIGAGQTVLPYPDQAQSLDDPLFKVTTDLTNNPAVWTFRVTVKGSQMWLSVYDGKAQAFHTVGQPWDLTKFATALQNAGYASSFNTGGVGVWSNVDTGIGVTNLVVRLHGPSLLRVNSRWEN